MAQQFNVVELGRRRRWSEDEKFRIVMDSLEAPRLVSPTARRYGIFRSLLMALRRALKVVCATDRYPAPHLGVAVRVGAAAAKARLGLGRPTSQRHCDAEHHPMKAEDLALASPASTWETVT